MLDPHIQILEIHGAKGAETFQYITAISKNQRILKESKIHKTECHTRTSYYGNSRKKFIKVSD